MTAPVAQTGAGNVTTATSASANSLACNKPANIADGDVLVCAGYFRNSGGTITPPAGWSQLGPLNTTNETFGLWFKPITNAAGEAASYTFSTSAGSNRLILTIFRVTGANLNGVQDAAGALAAYTGTASVTDPSVTAVSSEALLLAYFINNTTVGTLSTFSAPSGMTEVVQAGVNTGSATSSIGIYQQALSASGSTGTRQATISPSAANSGGFMVTVAPQITGAATLQAASSLTADATRVHPAAATLQGGSTLAATATAPVLAAATLTAAAALTATGTAPEYASATLTAVSALTASSGHLHTAAATLTASSSLTATTGVEQLNVLTTGGVWQPAVLHELVSGSWT